MFAEIAIAILGMNNPIIISGLPRLTPPDIQRDCANVKIDNNLTDLQVRGER